MIPDPVMTVSGFGFGMAVWAICVAASMAMRWVRELASAAS